MSTIRLGSKQEDTERDKEKATAAAASVTPTSALLCVPVEFYTNSIFLIITKRVWGLESISSIPLYTVFIVSPLSPALQPHAQQSFSRPLYIPLTIISGVTAAIWLALIWCAAHFNVILSEESTYQLKRKSDKIDKIMIVYLDVYVVLCCAVVRGDGWRLFEASIVLSLLLLKRYGCHCRYSFCVDFVLGRFAYDSSLSHQIWIMPFTCQMHTQTHTHTHIVNGYTRVRSNTPANMPNECAFFIWNIFELYFIRRRYSYWWPLNLALAVSLWTSVCANERVSTRGHTIAFLAHALLWFEHMRWASGIDENLCHYYYWSK